MRDVVDVLVVDDNEGLLELSTRVLRKAGFSVAAIGSFEELARVLVTTNPRLILMDVQMPELFGDDVAATLRHQRGEQAKIWLYSSLDEAQLRALAHDAKLDGAISKNLGVKHLVAEVSRILG